MSNKTPKLHRTCWAIDLENLIGGNQKLGEQENPEDTIKDLWNQLKPAIAPGDQVLVATGPAMAKHALFALQSEGVRFLVGRGIDGADNALLDAVDEEFVARRFGSLVIASGDHKLAPMARRARLQGIKRVWNLTANGGGRPSRVLREACTLHAQLNTASQAAHGAPTGFSQVAA